MKLEDYIDIANKNYTEFVSFKNEIFNHTLRWEGGGKLHNVPGDSGGWTIWGIAYNHNSGLFKDLADFKDTTYTEAAAVAFAKYYLPIKADEAPDDIKLMYFDMAYNMGTNRAKKILQKCAGVKQDGIVGPKTISAMKLVSKECLYCEREGFYNRLVMRNNKMKKFIKGWMNRLKDIHKQ